MRSLAITGAILAFLAIWTGCTCRHWNQIESIVSANRPGGNAVATENAKERTESLALTATMSENFLTLRGTVPDAATKEAVLNEAKRLFGNESVIDQLTVSTTGKSAPAGWQNVVLKALPLARTVGFTVGDRKLTFHGGVPTDKVKADTLALAGETLPEGWTLDDRLHVGAEGVAKGTLVAERAGDTVALSGTVPSSEARDAIVLAAREQLGPNGFTETLKVADSPAPTDPEWLAIAKKVVVWGKIAPVALDKETATLRGTLPSEVARKTRAGLRPQDPGRRMERDRRDEG